MLPIKPKLEVLLIVVLGIFFSGFAFAAPTKVAFVIGNSDYKSVPKLKNPRNDATDLAQSLEQIGFEVTTGFDLDQNSLLRGLRRFQTMARSADVAIIYYAGHGIEVGKRNYLIPADAELKVDTDVPFETVELDTVVLAASGARHLSLVILDACRNNPFASQMARTVGFRSVGRGLAEVEPQGNTLIAFAAKAGTVASDGAGKNSPYAKALIDGLKEPSLEVGFLFRKIRDQVLEETRGAQEPFFYGSLSSKRLFLNEKKELPETSEVDVSALPTDAQEPSKGEEISKIAGIQTQSMVWQSIKDSGDPDLIEQFLTTYPKSPFEPFANILLQKLRAKKSEAASAQNGANDQKTSSVVVVTAPAPSLDEVKKPKDKTEELAALEPKAEIVPETLGGPQATEKEADIILLSRSEFREMQERLTILEFKPGPIDGLIGNRTRTAIVAFASKSGLVSNGEPTWDVLNELRKSVTEEQLVQFRIDQKQRLERARRAAAEKQRKLAEEAVAAEIRKQDEATAAALKLEAEAKAAAAKQQTRRRKLEASDDDRSSSSSEPSDNQSTPSDTTERGDRF